MKKVNIIVWNNSAGLSRSSMIICQVLKDADFQISVNGVYTRKTRDNIFDRIKKILIRKSLHFKHEVERIYSEKVLQKKPYDINLFLEYIDPEWFPYAHINCLIPNQEWLPKKSLNDLGKIDWVLCKTKYAQAIFDKLGCQTEFVSFTSLDRFQKDLAKDYNSFFHLAGSSLQKGTNTIIKLWSLHPEWPCIKIIQNPENVQPIIAKNIEYIAKYVPDLLLQEYQNLHGIHLCPSEAEGFGHYIVEAMSCRSVVVTTDAPPMNELVTCERGNLVNYSSIKNQNLGINYYVDFLALESKIEELLATDLESKKQLAENARIWYEENDLFFRKKIVDVLQYILQVRG